MPTIHVAILDNDIWSAHSIAQWVAGQPSCAVLWCLSSTSRALHECLFSMHKPDVLLLDMALGEISGSSVCRRIRQRDGTIGILGMTAYDCRAYIDDLVLAGAQGIVDKSHIMQDLPDMLQAVSLGKSACPEPFKSAEQAHAVLLTQDDHLAAQSPVLSGREREILREYGKGLTAREIADKTGLSANSIYTYLHRAMGKVGVHSRAEVIQMGNRYDMF